LGSRAAAWVPHQKIKLETVERESKTITDLSVGLATM
jgi:hypothetical protein